MRLLCKSKIHRARISKCDIHYKGSIGIDKALLDAGDIYTHEIVQVVNVSTGARFETYVIEEKEGTGAIALYGGAARLGKPGEVIIVMSYAFLTGAEARTFVPRIIIVNDQNKIVTRSDSGSTRNKKISK